MWAAHLVIGATDVPIELQNEHTSVKMTFYRHPSGPDPQDSMPQREAQGMLKLAL